MPARRLFLIATLLAAPSLLAQAPAPHAQVIDAHNPLNSAATLAKHYVVLVSLDGFRYDYPKEWGAPNLMALGQAGAYAPQGMLPSYPSLTFPNHYTIVTGLYPEHSGIVTNNFWDATRNDNYTYKSDAKNSDGTWYSGTPLWELAELQGMRSASFYWPASSATIQGTRPAFFVEPYEDLYDGQKRVDQVISWLKLPAAERPHFITLYYADTDHAGHDFGPDTPQEQAAVHKVDALIGNLRQQVDTLGLPVDIIVVSDHGMVNITQDPKVDNRLWTNLEDYADLTGFHTDGMLLYAPSEAAAQRVYLQLKSAVDSGKATTFKVYRRKNMPKELHYDENPREGDPVVVITCGCSVRARASAPVVESTTPGKKSRADHGYDPALIPEMKAIFFAYGPDIKPGTMVAPFVNVNLYDFIAKILDLKPAPNDGSLKVLEPILKK